MKQLSVRELSIQLLEDIDKSKSYSNLALHNAIEKARLPERDSGLLTELVYGTVQNELLLDYSLAPFIKKKKLMPWVRHLLRVSAYQMILLDRIPDHAILNEAVTIAKKRGHKGISGFVNAVLRSAQREGWPDPSRIEDLGERLSVQYSHPRWLVNRWLKQFGLEATERMLEINMTPPPSVGRVNTNKWTRDEFLLASEEEAFEKGTLAPEAVFYKGNIARLPAYHEGDVTVQDESSMLVGHAVGATSNQQILDACAAPGGKTTHLAELMKDSGRIDALDLHAHKTKLIEQQAKRLDLASIHTQTLDVRKASEVFAPESFDHILVDAPCSGLGVIRRKPDIKWAKQEEDITRLATVQQDILRAVAPLLKPGGRLVYSTCTIDAAENADVITLFLSEQNDFERDPSLKERMPKTIPAEAWTENGDVQLLPHMANSDGFYVTALQKKKVH
ncbi:16S rRNA (cytosine(967)-C(5))-methyltransferase RsmB [Aureibacillus halotolerans]|uniref:16S rRNA (cytosine(967)-C(5))-methyltransferase n=1 Tax=Aureibacillus halotolerans TaxID=1508390 RepID=A0A4R6U764_9BACI|nr:16S rRNA (cytosine(967)-C(5))-methyltransferase RsmB [Aureibacillus halotolerans]TDQ42370.1 16S rRNA (cytosine967-C5)-methyltransferase [Aureibacillus halotolerans]